MKPSGTIYKQDRSPLSGDVVISMPLIERLAYHILRIAGASFLVFAIIGLVFAYGPIIKEEAYYDLGLLNKESQFKIAEAERITSVQKEAEYWGVNSHFSVVVPKINAKSNVIANTDPANEKAYLDALKEGVAHAKGTYFPGQGENIYLFSHSTNSSFNVSEYNAVFYLLRKLEKGDTVIVFFADRKYEYTVEDVVIASSDNLTYLTENTESERLVLQTCDPPGTSWKRLLVIAKPSV